MSTESLLLTITNCPNVAACKGGALNPCSEVVGGQAAVDLQDHHVPEPWNGALETAPVLFVSSNPAINLKERYPTPQWADDLKIDFFLHRFSGGKEPWTKNFRTLLADHEHDRAPRAGKYWSEIHARAVELLGPGARPGVDYALTEVVHCKSSANTGVDKALNECASRYLVPILEASGARVIVLIGMKAQRAFMRRFGGPEFQSSSNVTIGGRNRMLISIGAPNSAQARKLAAPSRRAELERARKLLASR